MPGWDGVRGSEGVFGWVCREASKPGRADGERWVLHATPAWSVSELERSREEVVEAFMTACASLFGERPESIAAHRWRYALAARPMGEKRLAVFDEVWGLGLCGDALVSPRVEGAWLSGAVMAESLLCGRAI